MGDGKEQDQVKMEVSLKKEEGISVLDTGRKKRVYEHSHLKVKGEEMEMIMSERQ